MWRCLSGSVRVLKRSHEKIFMGVSGCGVAELRKMLAETERKSEGEERYRRFYCLAVLGREAGCREVEEKAKERMKEVFEELRGADLFITGEVTERLKNTLQLEKLNSRKEYMKEILGLELEKTEYTAPDVKIFREIEPKLDESLVKHASKRGGKGKNKKEIKRERTRAQEESNKQILRRRKEDQAYSKYIKEVESKIRKQK